MQVGELMGGALGRVTIGSTEAKLQGVAMHHIAIAQASSVSRLSAQLNFKRVEDLDISITNIIHFYREQCIDFLITPC